MTDERLLRALVVEANARGLELPSELVDGISRNPTLADAKVAIQP